ncbi:MAG TPA: single-stranded-DNA-specific exonuclease RecJ [Chlorobaculum sp.]|uniref:Single-stranded-DNA-specific exonuclease RecJ n=1 Tax=Chlorobaculum tepidum (strain ATCC 49652 / DSM 12025 / NBRC 103806 / TLS) TaxID=194439 RepID=Q8KFG6_CHLTE|nr:single-stranded-DNA-specific exonuclease RecJ [Chlorobaculum tepidum]AAM71606.1 single-stranded-DNA-specific exonuclease RecJ [Chlorobaculum tepidum TLS]HBU23832.1 single-stranded-DNA-specific exonuclease RecJ [Chlorobaculum sp.]
MKRYRWTCLEPEPTLVQALSEAINVSSPIAAALVNRGISSFEEARRFFRPSLDEIPSPFLFNDMKRAVGRLSKAIFGGEKIMVYGDYDVDGTSGTAMLSLFLREMGAEVCHYINDRFTEGYGLSEAGIAWAFEQGVSLIVTVDCGIRAIDEVQACVGKGVDVIVCDHHEAGELPAACAILNPKVEGCGYPFRELCGCGVAFKLMQAMVEARGESQDRWRNYLDFVAVATAADMVSLQGENRAYLREGLELMRRSPRVSFQAMAANMKLNLAEFSMMNITYGIAPRINAAGRMESAGAAMQWLLSSDESEARLRAAELEALNVRRRQIDAEITARAETMVAGHCASFCSSIVLYDEAWHLGVLGIVASKLLDKYQLPTVVMGRMNGLIKGSVRSVDQLNIYDVLHECRDHLEQFGGHHQAAGLTLRPEQLEAFRRRFDEVCRELLPVEARQKTLLIDADLTLDEITPKFLNVLEQFAPFGFSNREPLFTATGCRLVGKPKLLRERHVKFTVRGEQSSSFEVIAFDRPDIFNDLEAHGSASALQLVCIPERNQWNGREYVQLRVMDMAIG